LPLTCRGGEPRRERHAPADAERQRVRVRREWLLGPGLYGAGGNTEGSGARAAAERERELCGYWGDWDDGFVWDHGAVRSGFVSSVSLPCLRRFSMSLSAVLASCSFCASRRGFRVVWVMRMKKENRKGHDAYEEN
jgi:hypothetical protein